MIHSVIALVVVSVAYVLGIHVYASLATACVYMGREHAQAEQRVISQYYGNKRANAPWWCGFEYRAWTVKGMLDWVLPLIISILVSVIA